MLSWGEDTEAIEAAMARFHVRSGKCAALARVVRPIAEARFGQAIGVQILPEEEAFYLVPRDPGRMPYWGGHLYVETCDHAVDALTGPDGYDAGTYRDAFWHYADTHRVRIVDPETVDIGIQAED